MIVDIFVQIVRPAPSQTDDREKTHQHYTTQTDISKPRGGMGGGWGDSDAPNLLMSRLH